MTMTMANYEFYLGCSSIGALEAARRAARDFELREEEGETTASLEVADEISFDSADTIYRALTWGPLGARYNSMFTAWLKSESKPLPIDNLAKAVGVSVSQVQAQFSKLSARIRRIASQEELDRSPKTALGLLVDITYGADNSTAHRLTPAGAAAVKRYLGV